jgi:hypothetical protein
MMKGVRNEAAYMWMRTLACIIFRRPVKQDTSVKAQGIAEQNQSCVGQAV